MKRQPFFAIVVAIVAALTSSQTSAVFPLGHARAVSANDSIAPRSGAGEGLSAKELEDRGFVAIPAGTFMMGSPSTESGRREDEGPRHSVTLSAFYMGAKEVTQAEWVAVMGSNPSWFSGDTLPVENVRWYDAVAYCNKRSLLDGLVPCYHVRGSVDPETWGPAPDIACDFSANGYRLPTEAEWEYACRAGTTTAYNTGETIDSAQANFNVSGFFKTVAAGSYAANAWGLHDMHGNVWEWCWDFHDSGYYGTSPEYDPKGPCSGDRRVARGGGWLYEASHMRASFRYVGSPDRRNGIMGFRLVCRPFERKLGMTAGLPYKRGFVAIPAGTFKMGSPASEGGGRDERPQHDVAVSAFYMGEKEVTHAEWESVMGPKATYFECGARPVEWVSWYDAVAYCNKKSMMDGLRPSYSVRGSTYPSAWEEPCPDVVCDFGANGYRLPTEAEWEYACRAGTSTAYNTGATITPKQANMAYLIEKPVPAGSYAPNAWGLYDMHGNMWEWCWDWYDSGYYAKSPAKDPSGPPSGEYRVVRGGAYNDDAEFLRSSSRNGCIPKDWDGNIGFRIVFRP